MSKAFYIDVEEALRGFLPKALRDFHSHLGFGNLKIWYASWHEHYEVQAISGTFLRSTGIKGKGGALEIGFHAEHPRPAENDDALARLAAKERTWRRRLGAEAVAGPFIGRKEQKERWRRVSELWEGAASDDDGAAIEAAERLGTYIKTFEPLLARAPDSRCACWKGP